MGILQDGNEDLCSGLRHRRRKQHAIWGGFFAALLLLLSIYSEGFFLYAAIAVMLLSLISLGAASVNL